MFSLNKKINERVLFIQESDIRTVGKKKREKLKREKIQVDRADKIQFYICRRKCG